MTIKTDQNNADHDVEEGGEIFVVPDSAVDNTDGSIPMATAVPVGEPTSSSSSSGGQQGVPPPYNPSYSGTTTSNNTSGGCVTTTTVTSTTSYIDQSQSQQQQQQVQQDEELAMRIQQQQQQSALRPTQYSTNNDPQPEPVLYSSVQVQQVPQQQQQQQPQVHVPPPPQQQIQTSPPGLPPHGRWVQLVSVGPTTWTVCTILSVITCFFICLPCGLWAFLCPCDEERVYLLDNKLFNDRGQMITANARTRRYRG